LFPTATTWGKMWLAEEGAHFFYLYLHFDLLRSDEDLHMLFFFNQLLESSIDHILELYPGRDQSFRLLNLS